MTSSGPHARWRVRPFLVVVPKAGREARIPSIAGCAKQEGTGRFDRCSKVPPGGMSPQPINNRDVQESRLPVRPSNGKQRNRRGDAVNDRAQEDKALLAGLPAFIGTYTVDEAGQLLTQHAEAGTFPDWNGVDRKRSLTLVGVEMKRIDRTPAIGEEVVEVVWRRARQAALAARSRRGQCAFPFFGSDG